MELILSSGFLAFARHCGVIDAILDRGLQVDGLCGTSSGALVGALWLAGHHPNDIEAELMNLAPYRMLALSYTPWRGLLSMRHLQRRLENLLPESFSDLRLPFGVGVCHKSQGHLILKEGHLPSAVAASCAFLSPIGHKNNTLIMGPGGYEFGDYWRMGLPLEIIVIIVAVPTIMFVWPL